MHIDIVGRDFQGVGKTFVGTGNILRGKMDIQFVPLPLESRSMRLQATMGNRIDPVMPLDNVLRLFE